MQERSIGDGVGITLVFDGTSKTIVGNFLGVYFIPPQASVAASTDSKPNQPARARGMIDAW